MNALRTELEAFLKRLGPYFLKFELELKPSASGRPPSGTVWSARVPLSGAPADDLVLQASPVFLRRAARGLLGIAGSEIGEEEAALALSELAIVITSVVVGALPGEVEPGTPVLSPSPAEGVGSPLLALTAESRGQPLQVLLTQASGS